MSVDAAPSIAFVVATRDEEQNIAACLLSLLGQDYPRERVEVVVADGGSVDDTREVVAAFAADDPRVRLLDNPKHIAAAAFNIGIRATTSDIVSLVSAHSKTDPEYAGKLAAAFAATGASVVGGRAVTRVIRSTPVAAAIARAMSSPFGVGNARFRHGGRPGWVDTAFPGAYRRELFEEIGLFDERLVRNQDDELHLRARRAGYPVWFDPDLVTIYHPRPTLAGAFRQYADYGRWRCFTIWQHRRVAALRHLAPAALIASLAFVWMPGTPRRAAQRRSGVVLHGAYAAFLVAATVREARRGAPVRELVLHPVALATLHAGYGVGFWHAVATTLAGRCPVGHERVAAVR